MARDVVEVIDAMVEVLQGIPDPLPKHKHLETALRCIRRDAMFVAPECVGEVWERLTTLLEDSVGEPHAAYERKLKQIFNDEPDMDGVMKRIEVLEQQVGKLLEYAIQLRERLGPYQ
jgi:hypothetical protein